MRTSASNRRWLNACCGALALAMGLLSLTVARATGEAVPPAQPLSATAALETTRFMVDATAATPSNPHGAVAISPDGDTYVARLVRGDVRHDGVWMEMITGTLRSLDAASNYRTVAQRFSSGLGAGDGQGGANQDTSAQASPIQWMDRDHVVFLWSDEAGHRQVTQVNVRTGDARMMTQHPTSIVTFKVSAGGVLFYCALAEHMPHDRESVLRTGFTIEPDTDAPSLMLGRINEGPAVDRLWNTEWFVLAPGATAPRRLSIAGRDQALDPLQSAALSPDAVWAVVNTNAPMIPADWDRYENPRMARKIRVARPDPRSMEGRLVHQLWLVNTATGASRALWSAPVDIYDTRIAWRADSRALVLAPTYLPPGDSDAMGRLGSAAVVIDRDTGRYERLPINLSQASVIAVHWRSDEHIELVLRVQGQIEQVQFEKSGSWRPVPAQRATPGLRIELQQDLNTPPTLVAIDPRSGRSKRILDPNPTLGARIALGRVERVEGAVGTDERWHGLLFYPPDYRPGRRYPLVIQSVYGPPATDEFTLYGYQSGYGLGPTFVASYPGRLLAARGMLVLHLNVEGGAVQNTPKEADLRRRAFERAAEQLVAQGLADRALVGLAGFSRNGFYVEYTLTHSTFPFAAALTTDNWDAGYVAQTFLGYNATDANGAAPFGGGLAQWLANAPGFGADRVRTPLLQIEQSNALLGVLVRWELFARLRYLKRPVEFYVVPRAQLGVHNTQNPTQILALQTRSTDWFAFWLNNDESAIVDEVQRERWRSLRELHRVHLRHLKAVANRRRYLNHRAAAACADEFAAVLAPAHTGDAGV